MIRIGITGQSGFVGGHLYNTIMLLPEKYKCIPFRDDYFREEKDLRLFVRECDVIVHLAAMNRDPDPQVIYETNLRLVKQLIAAMEVENVTPHILFSSSTQEESDNVYGKSKREGRVLFEKWAKDNETSCSGLIVPNVFGPFCKPNYNSFIATFCHKLTHGDIPQVLADSQVKLIYVNNLCEFIMKDIDCKKQTNLPVVERIIVPHDIEKRVTEILSLLENYKSLYLEKGVIPALADQDEVNLFNTFRSYIDHDIHFPVKLVQHADSRGVFVETIKLGVGGQVSFSTTVPGITRGNHYHTRKIERFTVIKGEANIQLRRIGSEEVLNFALNGKEPAYVDMPVWYTHNITNIGDTELYTQFWINEWYDPANGDTYYEEV